MVTSVDRRVAVGVIAFALVVSVIGGGVALVAAQPSAGSAPNAQSDPGGPLDEGPDRVRVKIYASGPQKEQLQRAYGVRHDFGDVFTTTISRSTIDRLRGQGVRVARVAVYRPIHHRCGHSGGPPGSSDPCPDTGISVSWVNPTDGDTVSGAVSIAIDASDDSSITEVSWTVDGGTERSTSYNSTSGLYEATWNSSDVDDGDHTLTAVASDDDGNSEEASIVVTVDNVESDTEARVADQTPYGVEQVYNDSSISSTSGGTGVDVALLDTGVDTDHPDLVNRLEQCVDFTGGGPMQTKIDPGSCEDKNGHGTHTAGTALADAGSDGAGVYGVAPEADLFAYKVCGGNGCYADDIAAAIDYAGDNGAEVVSMSLGGDSQSDLIADAIDRNKDTTLVVAAAGNDGPDLETMDYPGADPDVIGVAAIDADRRVADFSSRGVDDDAFQEAHKYVEVAAAGVDVLSTWNDGGYNAISGTSMATPHVSGLAAKVWASGAADLNGDGTTTPDEVRQYLQDSAGQTDITAGQHAGTGYDPAAGIGLPTVP